MICKFVAEFLVLGLKLQQVIKNIASELEVVCCWASCLKFDRETMLDPSAEYSR